MTRTNGDTKSAEGTGAASREEKKNQDEGAYCDE